MDIGYKYNMQNVISFIVTYNTGSTKAGLLYLSNYTDHFSNAAINPVDIPLVMFKLFGSVKEVDSHKNSSQSYLALDKFWVNLCG